MRPSSASGGAEGLFQFDPAEPLKGFVVCCTSIAPEFRARLAQSVAELGGVHKYDLTPDVTHLIVGDYDTPKYRHVARERPDVRAMDAAWIDDLTEAWKNDDEIDFLALQEKHQLKPLERRGIDPGLPPGPDGKPPGRDSLLVCMTGFGDLRDEIADKVTSNGGNYTGDLTRRCTHLIVNRPEGKKYSAAKTWGIRTVTLAWLDQTIDRGLILEEAKFDPLLPPEEQGVGAWTRKEMQEPWGKRARSVTAAGLNEDGPRKLRKTASMKMNAQRNNIWGDILGRSTSRESSSAKEQQSQPQPPSEHGEVTQPAATRHQSLRVDHSVSLDENQGIFAGCCFYIHDFSRQRTEVLLQTILTLGGAITRKIDDVSNTATSFLQRFIVVPQASKTSTHPPVLPDITHLVTEYYIEKCLHNRRFFHPNSHVLGRPFALFPIPELAGMAICSAAFTGIELNQVAHSVAQLGARYEEEFRRGTTVLVCKDLGAMRKEKLRMALKWGVPVVSADWLWELMKAGYKTPYDQFIFPELKARYEALREDMPPSLNPRPMAKSIQRTRSEPSLKSVKPLVEKPSAVAGIDKTAFEPEARKTARRPSGLNPTISADFATAVTHQAPESIPCGRDFDAPLSEISSARLNRSPSPTKHGPLSRTRSEPTAKQQPTRQQQTPNHAQPPNSEPSAKPSTGQRQAAHQQQADEAKKMARAAERQALSSKLTSLIDSTTPSNLNLNNNNNNNPHSATNSKLPDDQPPSGLRPRRRQILGRAISNASNASSASVDVASKSAADSLADDAHVQGLGVADADEAGREAEPPATQLEYGDPRAQEVKAALMSRMMGGSGDVKPVAATVETLSTAGGRSLRKR